MTVNGGNIRKGMYILHKNAPHLVTFTNFVSPGKGSAFTRTKLQNVYTGNTQEFTFKSSENIEVVEVSSIQMQFLYIDGEDVVFMNPLTYEQVEVSEKLMGEKVKMLTPDVNVYVMFYEGKAIDVSLPPKIKLKVVYAEDSVAGNTMGTARKEVKLETGMLVLAPLFVKEGDVLLIDTETMSYVSRA